MGSAAKNANAQGLRVDRWLWCARFFKTRSLAALAVKRGHIRLNGERAKPARDVKIGDSVTITRGPETIEVAVFGLPLKRGPAALNAEVFEESPDSIERREQNRLARASQSRKPTDGKPDKRTRRLLRSHQRSIL